MLVQQPQRGNDRFALPFIKSFWAFFRLSQHLTPLVALVLLVQASGASPAWAQASHPTTPPALPHGLDWEESRLEELREPAPVQVVKPESKAFICFFGEMPEFKGGVEALRKFMRDSLRHPFPNAQGRVYVNFVIDEAGAVTDARVVKGLAPLLDAEAVRVVLSMPAWKPAINNGQAVPLSYTIPVDFTPEPADTKRQQR